MPIAEKLDELGRPAWIALMILGFIAFWPLGLAILAFLIWSGRMSCGRNGHWDRKMMRMQDKMDRMRTNFGGGNPMWGAALQRQPRLRRIPRRHHQAARGGAAGISRVPRTAALCQGQGRVRPVHGRPAQPSDAGVAHAELTRLRTIKLYHGPLDPSGPFRFPNLQTALKRRAYWPAARIF